MSKRGVQGERTLQAYSDRLTHGKRYRLRRLDSGSHVNALNKPINPVFDQEKEETACLKKRRNSFHAQSK